MSFALSTYVLATLIAFGGGGIVGFAGFGAGLFMAPLLTLVVPPATAVPLMILVGFTGTARLVPSVYREANFKRVFSLAIPAMICIPVGIYGLKSLNPEVLRRIVNGIVLAMVVLLAHRVKLHNADRLRVLVPAGAISGLLTGIASIGGPPVVVTFLSLDEPPRVMRGNLIVYFTISGVAAIVMLFAGRVVTREVLELLVVALPAFFLGSWFGSRQFTTTAEGSYRKVVLIFLAIVALIGLLWPV